MKSYQLAAAVLTALAATSAQADTTVNDVVIYDSKEKTMCVPVSNYDGKVVIQSLCDATAINKQFNLKVDEYGCAVSGQSLYKDNGDVIDQAPATVWGTDKEIEEQSLRACTEDDAAVFWVEL